VSVRRVQLPQRSALAVALTVALWLAGCATRAPEPGRVEPAPAPPTPPPVAAPLHDYERLQRDRAERAEAQGRWAEAALAWEVLSLLGPDDAGVRERLLRARAQIAQQIAGQRALAQAAQRRGDTDAAMQAWLSLLALDPSDRDAADALRQIERERNRRSQVGRFARSPLAPRRANDASQALSPMANEAARSANSQREHATMLARQGDLDGAIALLRDNAQWRNLPAHRALLADLYVRKAESLKSAQPEAARAAVEAALGIDGRHAGALALDAQLPRPGSRGTRSPATRPTSP